MKCERCQSTISTAHCPYCGGTVKAKTLKQHPKSARFWYVAAIGRIVLSLWTNTSAAEKFAEKHGASPNHHTHRK